MVGVVEWFIFSRPEWGVERGDEWLEEKTTEAYSNFQNNES